MPTNVIMPQMGESIFEGTVTKWLKKEGDKVKRDEPLFEISTDKVDSEIPAPAGGILKKIIVSEGTKVQINTVVAIIDEDGAAAVKESKPTAAPKAARSREPVAAAAPQTVRAAVAHQAVHGTTTATVSAPTKTRIFASPLVRRIAREENVDLSQLKGTGQNGRISKHDILAYLERRKGAPAAAEQIREKAAPPRPAGLPAEASAKVGAKTRVEAMSAMRQKIAEHMVVSRRTSAHVTTVFEVDMSKIVALREQEKDLYEQNLGTKLTFTPFFAKAAIEAMRDFPIINSSIDGNNIVYKYDINMGIAVALSEGLIVPVVKNAEEKNFLGLARSINDLAERARTKKLNPDDVQGGTFTITNPGIYGGLFGTPIINQPQVAIMGIGGIQKRPVVINDAIAIRSMAFVVLSFDHRVIDGAVADQFMARVKSILENWSLPIK